MKWTLISNASNDIKEYHLIRDGNTLVVMKYNPDQQTVRIVHEGDRLVFFMENAGYAHRLIFKSVYGVDQGKYLYNNRNHTGRLEINNAVFDYNIVTGNQPKLIVHQNNRREPLAVCQMPDTGMHPPSIYEQAGMVLSVCSFSGEPAVRRK
ncbi:hypothetical protein [Niastella populi]|uniref:Uncharacterized protein n=1 Tax=Niastella populi TaxID=550983 RepID=A0A1V9FE06_9BACT|nr:hypothetical protein [Niastella populi]OQP56603.1 hypothetical protein A4R26_05440 [Niastella populi]